MKLFSFSVVIYTVLAVTSLVTSAGFRPAGVDELSSVAGGGCWYCAEQDFCKTGGKACEERTAPDGTKYWVKWVATGITQKFCADIPAGKAGFDKCTSITPEDCIKVYTCSEAGCPENKCGPPGIEQKPTDCDFTGGRACTT